MNQEKIGQFIKELRKKNHLTQKEFADKLGVTYQAVSKWENAKNMPDIAILKAISNEFNINIESILNGDYHPQKKTKRNIIIFSIIFLIFLLIIIFLLLKNNDSFNFKKVTSNCDNFIVTGSAAYNKEKSSIYISNVEFCGEEQEEVYTSINCTLYETYQNSNSIISTGEYKENITLMAYLNELSISVDNYTSVCKEFSSTSLYLQINATKEDNTLVTYTIPLTLEDNCSTTS